MLAHLVHLARRSAAGQAMPIPRNTGVRPGTCASNPWRAHRSCDRTMNRVAPQVHEFGEAFGTGKKVTVSNQVNLVGRHQRCESQEREVGTLPRDGVNNGGQARLEVSGDGGAESTIPIEYQHGSPITRNTPSRHALTGHARARRFRHYSSMRYSNLA